MRAPPLPPSYEGGPPAHVQMLRPLAKGLNVHPKPPAPMPPGPKAPRPPDGPPPPHALLLARKPEPQGARAAPRALDGKLVRSGADGLEDVRRRLRPLHPVPKPPSEAPPPGVLIRMAEGIAKSREPGNNQVALRGGFHGGTWAQPHAPTPDWAVKAGDALVWLFAMMIIIGSTGVIAYWGTFFDSSVAWATIGASVAGCLVNLGVFESVKCVVFAMVALVADETAKSQVEVSARRARMALKAQRLSKKGVWNKNASVVDSAWSVPHLPYFGQ